MLSIVAFSIYVIIDTLQLPWKIQMRAMFKWGYAGIQITLTVLGLWTVVQLIKATEPVILHNSLLGTIKILK